MVVQGRSSSDRNVLGICVVSKSFWLGISCDSGTNFFFLGKTEASGPKKVSDYFVVSAVS